MDGADCVPPTVVGRILHLAQSTLALHAPANNPIHRAIFTGVQRLLGKLLDGGAEGSAYARDMLDQDPTFYPACAQLLLLLTLEPSASDKRGSTSDYVAGGVSASAPTSASASASGLALGTPEALRLLHSEAVLSFARLALAHPQPLPRCRHAADPPLAKQLHDSLDDFVSGEKAQVVRRNLSLALELMAKLKA